MAHKVSRSSRREGESIGWPLEFEVITVVADTYSELIAAIDQIPDADLTWFGNGDLGIEGMPNKVKGKWLAELRTPKVKLY